MQMKLLFLTLSCILVFSVTGQTQEINQTPWWAPTKWIVITQDDIYPYSFDLEDSTSPPALKDFAPELGVIFVIPYRPFLQVATMRDGVKRLIEYPLDWPLERPSDDYSYAPSLEDGEYEIEIPPEQMPRIIESQAMMTKRVLHSFWHEGFLSAPELCAVLGISDAQTQKICDKRTNYPESQEVHKLHRTFMRMAAPFLKPDCLHNGVYDVDEETLNKLFEIQQKKETLRTSFRIRSEESALTPEQIHKINEIRLATMGKIRRISSRAFEALDLTDAQRKEVERIKNELAHEFEKYLEDTAKNQILLMKEIMNESGKKPADRNPSEGDAVALLRWLKESPERSRILDEIQSQSRTFATLFQTKMHDVLTDDQRQHMQRLIDNPPEHVQIFLNKIRNEPWEEWW